MKILVALALLFINVAWALNLPAKDSQVNGRILNGANAAEGQFPHVVFLETETALGCSGALIGSEWVVTVAHCVFGEQSVTVYLGMTYMKTARVTHIISNDSIVIHDGFNNRTLENDIALIKIPDTLIGTFISPVPLPALDQQHIEYTQQNALVCGWGMNGNEGPLAEQLQWTLLPIISNEKCNEIYGNITENDMCASTTGGMSTCVGDSGSPLVTFKSYTLIGIYSASTKNGCESLEPIIFTRITSYLQWIKYVSGISY